MVKRAAVLALVLCLLLVLLGPGLAQAQGRLEVLESRTQMEFPSRLIFSLSVRSDVDISDIRLCYQIERVSFAEVTSEVYIEFVPASEVEVNWALEMVKIGGLPPGSGVEYWWLVKDSRGDKVETPPAQLRFDDLRYSWRNLTRGNVTVYWYEGGGAFGQEVMATAQQALAQLARDTGAELEKPVRLYVYADPGDLRGAMIYPQEWTGGVAFTRYGTIAIGISPSNIEWGRRAVAHELTHLVIHQMTLNPYSGLPAWLDEGLAMHTEGLLDP
ncbi:MAG TPA: peptidase MA domain-containing protein, partial [Dehalococcoidia bacterium]|nr:peptidase MA domain-containing protein [Dehalococcoidia bacterium]